MHGERALGCASLPALLTAQSRVRARLPYEAYPCFFSDASSPDPSNDRDGERRFDAARREDEIGSARGIDIPAAAWDLADALPMACTLAVWDLS